jgi:L-methionine (R)-S-oxide reductase
MFELKPAVSFDKSAAYAGLESQLKALLRGERDFIANAANTAALLWQALPDLNWAGFYRLAGKELVLGPDVHKFPGHIACDSASNSEIVLPLIKDGQLLGVLDLDSPKPGRFDAADQAGLERMAERLLAAAVS